MRMIMEVVVLVLGEHDREESTTRRELDWMSR